MARAPRSCGAHAAALRAAPLTTPPRAGSPTQALHQVSFDLHEQLAARLGVESYRRIPTLSVRTRPNGARDALSPPPAAWLDGDELASATPMDSATAQVTPLELTTKLMDAALAGGATLRRGVVTGIDTTEEDRTGAGRAVTAVRVDGVPVRCRRAVIAMGPWSVLAEDWLGVRVPLQGIKSASVVYRGDALVRAVAAQPYALFCGEDARYGTHLEVYPRNTGEVYICGIGGSDYVSGARLRPGGDTESQALVAADPQRVAAARAAFGGISRLAGGGEPDVKQACMRPCAPDAMPILGEVPDVAGAFLACGHNCWGILWAPVTGQAMAELLVDGAARCVDLTPFSPARFQPRGARGGRGRKQGSNAVGEQW
jgi:glycine/D-amino acid oxidase-like deaminating enzyme